MSEILNKIPFRIIIAWLVLIFILYNFFSVEQVDSPSVTVSPVRLVDAVVFIAMSAMVEDPMVDYSIASVRKLGKWKGEIYVITDHPQCFTSSVENFKITTIKVPSVSSIIEIKALKPKLMSYMPDHVHGVLYIDVDILITKNLMSFFQDLGNVVHQKQLSGMLGSKDEVASVKIVEQKTSHMRRVLANSTVSTISKPVALQTATTVVPFDFGAFPDAKGHYVGWCSGCEKWHSGVMWLRRGYGESCLQAWREILLSGKYDTDQQSLDFAEKNGSCRHGLTLPTRHLLFAKDYIGMALTSGQTFIHLTAAGRKEDTDYFYREFVIPGVRKSLHPPLNPNSLNHRKKCLPAAVWTDRLLRQQTFFSGGSRSTAHFTARMWRSQLNRSIREVRFVLKDSKDHHGMWRWIEHKLPVMRMLNPNTMFGIVPLNDDMKTTSACYLVYGDTTNREEEILSKGVSMEQFDALLKEKVAFGKTLIRENPTTNSHRDLPYDIVEARNTMKWYDDGPQ